MKGLPALVWEPHETDRRQLCRLLRDGGWAVREVGASQALDEFLSETWALVICSIGSAAGLATITHIRSKLGPETIIVATGPPHGSWPLAELFLAGASEYLGKPFQTKEIQRKLRDLQERWQVCVPESFAVAETIQPEPVVKIKERPLIGQAPLMLTLCRRLAGILAADMRQVRNVVPTPTTILLTGETGTGKELFARLIHERSRFQAGPFVVVNCATLPPELAEAELFGHEAGAFTGAHKARPGLWEQADGGTLFLDELTEAPPTLWPKLLRVLQDGQVRRVGGGHWRQADVQVVAASNRDLGPEINAGRFRRDLYHRFHHHLWVPPLRERREDILLLARHFAARYARQPVQFSVEARSWLEQYAWPGNVRELEHLIRSVLTQTGEKRITQALLQMHLAVPTIPDAQTQNAPISKLTTLPASLHVQVQDFKRQTALATLLCCGGNLSKAAKALGLSRPTLYRLLDDS